MTSTAMTQPPAEEREALPESAAREGDLSEARIWQMTQDLLWEMQRTEATDPSSPRDRHNPEERLQASQVHFGLQQLQAYCACKPTKFLLNFCYGGERPTIFLPHKFPKAVKLDFSGHDLSFCCVWAGNSGKARMGVVGGRICLPGGSIKAGLVKVRRVEDERLAQPERIEDGLGHYCQGAEKNQYEERVEKVRLDPCSGLLLLAG